MNQRGQTLVMFVLMLAVLLLGLLALVGDVGAVAFEYERANSSALLGAQAGAADIDLVSLYTSNARQLDPNAATVCRATAMQSPGSSATCTPSGTTITATVSRQARLPIPVWGVSVPVRAVRTAQAVFGDATPK